MINKYIKYYMLIILMLNIIMLIKPAHATIVGGDTLIELQQQMKTTGGQGYGTEPTERTMFEVISIVIKSFLGLLGVIFVIYIIYAGFAWMTAQGDEEKVTKAKDTIQRAVIGLIIIIAAYSITYFVFKNLPGGPSGGVPGGGSGQ